MHCQLMDIYSIEGPCRSERSVAVNYMESCSVDIVGGKTVVDFAGRTDVDQGNNFLQDTLSEASVLVYSYYYPQVLAELLFPKLPSV